MTTPRLQLVRDEEPVEQPEVRLSRCDRCGGPEVMSRALDGSWRSRHVCRPNDTMDWRVLAAGLLGSVTVVVVLGVAAAGLYAGARALGLLP